MEMESIKRPLIAVTFNCSTVPKKDTVLKTSMRSSLVIMRKVAGNFLTQNVVESKEGEKGLKKEPFTVLLKCEISDMAVVAKRFQKICIKSENEPKVPEGGWRRG